jgi:hypothetical protein
VLLVPDHAPLQGTLGAAVERACAEGIPVVIARPWTRGTAAFGSISDDDALDDRSDPRIAVDALAAILASARVPPSAARVLAEAIADREQVLDLGQDRPSALRPITLFERHALVDVLGEELASLLPIDAVRVQRKVLCAGELNHCAMGDDGVATIRLVETNGVTLGARTHALVHELGHALIGVERRRGRSYRASYGEPDFGRFLDPKTFDRPCDEEALVRAIADAWLLRRTAVTWSRTWPGAIDDVARDLHADDLAAFGRFRLAQGLGLPHAPIVVRKI